MRDFPGSNFVGGDWQNGFGVRFTPRDEHTFTATYTFDKLKQGPPGVVHGGAIAALFDEAMTAAAFHNIAGFAFTASLQINYHAPVFIGVQVDITAHLDRIEGRKIHMTAHIHLPDKTLAATATALFIEVKSPQ